MVTIYALVCPFSEEIRYIGKTEQKPEKRLCGHLREARCKTTSHKHRWLRKCVSAGLTPRIWILENVGPDHSWQDRERKWIKRAGEIGLNLTNQTAGGEGLVFIDEEAKTRYLESLSKAVKKRFADNPRYKKALVEANKRDWKERREYRIGAIVAGHSTKEVKEKLKKAMEEVRSRPGYKQERSSSAKKAWGKHREKMLAAISTPQCKSRQSARAKERWANPEVRERLMGRWTPEARAKQAFAIKERADKIKKSMTPEVRAKQAEKMKSWWAENPDHYKKCQAARTPEGNKRTAEATKRRWAEYRARKASQ